ncbi:MAG: DUF565 domain-containing protein [Cyanobacteriota bacterium]|nr:DUF565 domain-containing protein [Cyanobacteriota bacterium]
MPLPPQQTRYAALERRLASGLIEQLRRSWRGGSLALLALLLGYYAGQNLLTILVMRFPGGRPMVVLLMVLATELLVRVRSRMPTDPERPLGWVMLDNLRIGVTFACVLEAFKLGT